jgi:hypothetical protein
MRPLERRVQVQHLGDGTYRVAVYIVADSTPMMERKTEGISTREEAEEVAREYRQQLGELASMRSPEPKKQKWTLEQFEVLVMKKMPSFKGMVKHQHCDDTKPIEDRAKMFGWWLEDPR